MHRILVLVALALSFPLDTPAEETDAATFLAEARKKVLDHTAKGLKSLSAAVRLRHSRDEGLERVKDTVGFEYAWTAPEAEVFSFLDETAESLRKPLQEAVGGLWRDATGALWFDTLARGKDLALEAQDDVTTVRGTIEGAGEFQAVFDSKSGRMAKLVFPQASVEISYAFAERKDGLQVEAKEIRRKGALLFKARYDDFRDVSGYSLPTIVAYDSEKNSTEFGLQYGKVNDGPAQVAALDVNVVKTQVGALEKGWRSWSDTEKVEEMKELSRLDHDMASAALAKYGLSDDSLAVREAAALLLGKMKRSNVVPTMISAMGANEKNIRAYLALIVGLGEIGDQRAVDVLSKDWWNQRIGEYGEAAARAKIQALGNIRHASAVDALIDTLTLTQDDNASKYKTDIVQSLTKLTGQDFLLDRKAWKDWWKKNRATFKFE